MTNAISQSATCASENTKACTVNESTSVSKMTERFSASEMIPKTFTSSQGLTIPYRIYVPHTDIPEAKFPAILFLHGAGSRGTDNIAHLRMCIPQLMNYIVKSNHPATLIVPQCPPDMQWVDTPWGGQAHTMSEVPSKPLQAVIELMNLELAAAPVDDSRLYTSGVSMGGYGVWEMLQRFPQKFAAALLMCGGGDTHLASTLVHTPIHVVHGEKDPTVPVERSRAMVTAIQAAGGTQITYLELKGAGHHIWTPTYNDTKNIDWLFSNRLAK